MRTLLILVAILAVTSAGRKKCRGGPIIDDYKQDVEVLYKVEENTDSPYQLAIDYETDTIFFSLSVNSTETAFQASKLNLKTKEYEKISGVEAGFANAVDPKNHVVYIGGSDGIAKYNYETKQAEPIASTAELNIWQLFYKDDLYYTIHPEEQAFVLKDGNSSRVPELEDTKVLQLALDNDKNIYFSNASGLYLHEKSNGEVSYVGNFTLNAFTADKDGHIYFSTLEGLYRIKDLKTAELLTNFEYIYGMAIEADGNVIYSTDTEVIRLKPTDIHCPRSSKKKSE